MAKKFCLLFTIIFSSCQNSPIASLLQMKQQMGKIREDVTELTATQEEILRSSAALDELLALLQKEVAKAENIQSLIAKEEVLGKLTEGDNARILRHTTRMRNSFHKQAKMNKTIAKTTLSMATVFQEMAKSNKKILQKIQAQASLVKK